MSQRVTGRNLEKRENKSERRRRGRKGEDVLLLFFVSLLLSFIRGGDPR